MADGVNVIVAVGVCVAVYVTVDSGPRVGVAPPVSGMMSSGSSMTGYSVWWMMMGKANAPMPIRRSVIARTYALIFNMGFPFYVKKLLDCNRVGKSSSQGIQNGTKIERKSGD